MCHIDVSYIVSKLIFNACSLSVVASVVLVDVIKDVSTRQLQGIKTIWLSQTARRTYHKKNNLRTATIHLRNFLYQYKHIFIYIFGLISVKKEVLDHNCETLSACACLCWAESLPHV